MGGQESKKEIANQIKNIKVDSEKNTAIEDKKIDEQILDKPDGQVIIYGFLQKRSKYIHLWKTRFCILTNHYLFAFTGVENDADCTMALLLSNVNSIHIVKGYKKRFVFSIQCENRNYYFGAENRKIMNKWINELEKVVTENMSAMSKNIKETIGIGKMSEAISI